LDRTIKPPETPMTAQPSDLARTLAEADKLAREIIARDVFAVFQSLRLGSYDLLASNE
jgi:hypothetical protein